MLDIICDIATDAGRRILDVYNDASLSSQVDYKADDSPLTIADQRAHELIMQRLTEAFPEIPVLSEEGQSIDYETRKQWKQFWLVDPLDGTKEFINRNGEFTVNIALVRDRVPVLGVVHAPARECTYFGALGEGAYKRTGDQTAPIHVRNRAGDRVAVRSKSHAAPEEESVLEQYDVVDTVSVGSSLKFCLVAEGTADVYYRHGPTMEWDVGAGQAVVQAAGGKVLEGTGPEPFRLNKQALLNGSFLCLGFE